MSKSKKSAVKRKNIILKSDNSFDELIEDAYNDKVLKKTSRQKYS